MSEGEGLEWRERYCIFDASGIPAASCFNLSQDPTASVPKSILLSAGFSDIDGGVEPEEVGTDGGVAMSEAVEGVGSSVAMGGEVLEREGRLTEGVVDLVEYMLPMM